MSNLTPEDVDVRLTTVQNKLDGEDLRLWQGLEDEKISRIAGDEANKQFTLIVQDANQGTERRLSTEVIHREEGDLRNIGSLTELAIALSDYRIKTDLEINNEKIARQQLGVDLNTKIDGFVTTWNHQVFTIYQAIQAVQSDVNFKYASMDQRIKKYEDMLQDITTDSIQITMDNGEINMGAWTILSQAREWDLEIIGMFKDYKKETNDNIDEAIKDIESKLPIKEDIIREALEALGNSPIITELQEELSGLEVTIDGVTQTMMEHRTEWQNEMVDLSKVLGDKVDAETTARVEALQTETKARTDEIRKETSTRTEQFRELDDGLTVEIQERIDGDNKSYELIENLKASSEGSLADVYNKIAVNTDGLEANALAIQQVTAEVEVAKDDAVRALVNSATALEQATSAVTQTKAVAERVDGVEVSLGNKVDTTVFNITKAEVERIDGVTKNHTEQLTTIDSTINSMDGVVKGHTTAIEALTVKQTESDGKLLLITERTTALESSVGGLTTGLSANVEAVNNLKTVVDKQANSIITISEDVTSVKARVDNISVGGTNYILNSGVWEGAPLAGGEDITASYSANKDIMYVTKAAGSGGVWLTNFLSDTQLAEVGTNFNLNDDVIFSVDVWIENGSSVAAPNVYWSADMGYMPLVLAPGQEVKYDGWYRYFQTRKYVPSGLAFHFSFENAMGSYRFRNPVIEAGTKPSSWKRSDADFASSSALNTLRAEVTAIDGKVTATANDLTVLKSNVENNHAEIVNNYYTKVAADQATANQVSELKSELSTGKGFMQLDKGIFSVETGSTSFIMQDAITNSARITSTVTGTTSSYWRECHKKDQLVVGDKYTTSGYFRTSRSNLIDRIYVRTYQTVSDNYIFLSNPDTEWTYFSTTGTANATDMGVLNNIFGCYMPASIAGDWIEFKNVQSVKGTVDTRETALNQAKAMSTLEATVKILDGAVTTNATQMVTLSSAVYASNKNFCKKPLNGVGTPNVGIRAFYWENRLAVYDVEAGNGTWVASPIYNTEYSSINSHLTRSFDVCTSMDITFDNIDGSGATPNNFVLPALYYGNGQGNLRFKIINPPAVLQRNVKYRCYVVHSNVGGNTIHSDYFGFSECVGRYMIENVKVEVGNTPTPYSSDSQNNKVTLQQTNEVVDGVKAVSTVSVNNNGFMSGYGLISQLVNGVVVSAFGIDADYFYVGKSMSNAKKPFMVLTTPQVIGGVTYPAGVWMDVALIANATIGTAHIQDASITNAKIVDLHADKITAGIINADRIGANTITTEKLIIGDTTNLWANQYFDQKGARPEGFNGRVNWNGGINEIPSRMGVQMYGRDHIAPYSTRIPIKNGESIMIEYIGGMNGGPGAALGVGLWVYDGDGSRGTRPFQYGAATLIEVLGGGWGRYRRTFQVSDNGSGKPAAYGCLYFQIEQSEQEANPTYWTVGNVIIRKPLGGELIVNGAVTADKLYSNTVSGMFANFGTMTTYKNPANPNGARMVMQGSLLRVYDDNNVMRVRLGLW